ncbi:TIMELESS-interacting protein [Genypterus blacodes]|uniref:TIMELESS-interacting protein n=1 Tax=Genypterus blacodes TaxID=154954 RepID=UPI003F75FB95
MFFAVAGQSLSGDLSVLHTMDDIPDYDRIDDEAFPPLPPPHSPGLGGVDEANPFGNEDEDGEHSKLAEVPTAKRKGVKRPQPKLDSNRLISDRGLPALRTLFDSAAFKGKGHEAEDLRLLMQKMENWAHRLFPKLQFEDFIDKVEKLGAKKEVQTCLKRIRLDMPLTDEDFIGNDGEEEAAPEVNVFRDPDPFGEVGFSDFAPVHSTPAPATYSPASLTGEQQKRMELNRQRALEKRLARQQQQQQTELPDSLPVDSSAEQPPATASTQEVSATKDQDEGVEDLDQEPDSIAQQPIQPPPEDSVVPDDAQQETAETVETSSSPAPQLGQSSD